LLELRCRKQQDSGEKYIRRSFTICSSPPAVIRMTDDEIGGTYSKHERYEKRMQSVSMKKYKEDHT
jgi:hypothetical protein